MRFQRDTQPDEPEINLVPMIDVLLVLLIFLTATTTFARFSELAVDLPSAAAAEAEQAPEITVEVTADGRYAVAGRTVEAGAAGLPAALRAAAGTQDSPLLVIYADAQASHQAVVDVMQAARETGIARLTFAARQPVAR